MLIAVSPAQTASAAALALALTACSSAPPDFDFPLTREALKGHTELGAARLAETEEGGRRYLVAFVPTLSLGQSVVKLVSDNYPDTWGSATSACSCSRR